jgi:hypothetical protein
MPRVDPTTRSVFCARMEATLPGGSLLIGVINQKVVQP